MYQTMSTRRIVDPYELGVDDANWIISNSQNRRSAMALYRSAIHRSFTEGYTKEQYWLGFYETIEKVFS